MSKQRKPKGSLDSKQCSPFIKVVPIPSHKAMGYTYFPKPKPGQVRGYVWPQCDDCGPFRDRHMRRIVTGHWKDDIVDSQWIDESYWLCLTCSSNSECV